MGTFKNKTELKDVFNGLSSVLFTDTEYDLDGANNTGYPAFSATTAYAKGDLVIYEAKTYKFKNAHAAGAWSSTDVEEVTSQADGKLAIEFDYELPVTVDTLQVSQDDPTINHYKVVGLNGDWTTTAEAGDFTVQFTVPTKHTEVLKIAFGEDAYREIAALSVSGGKATGNWEGGAVAIDMKKVTGTIGLLDENKQNLMLISHIALYAKPMYENPGTEPFAIQFSGSIETSGDANFAWLKKKA